MTTTPAPTTSPDQSSPLPHGSGNETASAQPADAIKEKPSARYHWVFLSICLAVLVLALVMKVPGQKKVYLPVLKMPLPELCTAQRWLGMDCPGCGLTRCFISMAHGQFERAWWFNPAGVLLFILMVGQIPYQTCQIWRIRQGMSAWYWRADWLLWILVVMMLGQWVAKLFTRFL